MKCHSEKKSARPLFHCRAFSLPEVVVALIILAFVSSAVFVVVDRCMASAADLTARMQAFEVARDNMEKLLASASVSEMSDYGSSDKYPEIQWQTTIETFYEPLAARIWLQAVCSADYTDTAGNTRTIKLTHWLTEITKEQLLEIIKEKQKESELSAKDSAESEVADQNQSEQYKALLSEDKQKQSGQDKTAQPSQQGKEGTQTKSPQMEEVKKYCGYTLEELNQMPFDKVWQIMKSCGEF